jgi:hypothetical protein
MSTDRPSALKNWTPQQLAVARRWVETWKTTGAELERIRRQEIRQLDTYRSIELLCASADYTVAPRAPKPTSGLVEQQSWFIRATGRE